MTHEPITLSEDEFDERFPLLVNHLNPTASWAIGDQNGCLFETYGAELEFVRHQNPRCVWTLLDSDDGIVLASGRHFVNRIGYLVSTIPIPNDIVIEFPLEMPEDESGAVL